MTIPLPVVQAVHGPRVLRSDLFGPLDISDDDLIEFGDGLLGFPQCRSWALLAGTKPGTAWLQSAEHSALIFLLVDPFVFFEGFTADLSNGELRRLNAHDASSIALFAIVTLPGGSHDQCTANLQGPLVLNVAERRGIQVVFGEGAFDVKAPIPLSALL
jgi:flagellar assembly factor FliW